MSNPTRTLWRLTRHSRGAGCADDDGIAQGLRLHIAHGPLDTVLVRIGEHEQSYVVLNACAGCQHGRCQPGCRVELLRRLLERHAPELALQPVPCGLATRPYTRVFLAMPPPGGVTWPAHLLQLWPEARLTLSWRRATPQGIATAALLLVGAAGPDPRPALRAHGWAAWSLPGRTAGRWASSPIPPGLPWTWARRGEPALLLPEQADHVTASLAPSATTSVDQSLADWLHGLIANPRRPADDPAPPAEASSWPAGPGAIAPAALSTLIAQLLAEPSFQSARKGQSGLSKGRLAGLKCPGLSEGVARALMVWFDRAGVLAPPEDGQGPWRAPRPFALTDLDTIAAKLRETPLPTSEEIRAAYGGEA